MRNRRGAALLAVVVGGALAGCGTTVPGRANAGPVTVTVTEAPETTSTADEAAPEETAVEEPVAPETPPSTVPNEHMVDAIDCNEVDGDGDGGAIDGYSDKQDAFVSSMPNDAGEYVGCDDALTVLADYYAERPAPLDDPRPIEVDGASCNQGSDAPFSGEVICVWDGLVFLSWFVGGAGAY